MIDLLIIVFSFLFTLVIIAPIFAYVCDKEHMVYDRSCYFCDYAKPKYRLNEGEVSCPFMPLNRSSQEISECRYRKKSISFWEWVF